MDNSRYGSRSRVIHVYIWFYIWHIRRKTCRRWISMHVFNFTPIRPYIYIYIFYFHTYIYITSIRPYIYIFIHMYMFSYLTCVRRKRCRFDGFRWIFLILHQDEFRWIFRPLRISCSVYSWLDASTAWASII